MLRMFSALLVISLLQEVSGWSFSFRRRKQSCPFPPVTVEDIKEALWASTEAYDDHQINEVKAGYTITNVITREYKRKNVKFIVAEKSATVIIAFMGTQGASQLVQEFESILQKPAGVEVTIAGKKTQIVKYFWDVFSLLKYDLDSISHLWQPSKRFLITGHSLGGALASIFAVYAFSNQRNIWHNKNSRLITFGEPRVGNADFAEVHDQLIPPARKLHVINQGDIVPHLPPFLMGYRHHSRGLWLHTTSEWRVCRRKESIISCGNTHFLKVNIADHDRECYIRTIDRTPSKIKLCLSVIFPCHVYGSFRSAMEKACNK